MSLEGLVDALERYNTSVQIARPWQVSNKASHRGRFFGRRQRGSVTLNERTTEEEQMPEPRFSREDGVSCLELQGDLEIAQFKIED